MKKLLFTLIGFLCVCLLLWATNRGEIREQESGERDAGLQWHATADRFMSDNLRRDFEQMWEDQDRSDQSPDRAIDN